MWKSIWRVFFKQYKLTVQHMDTIRVIHVKRFHSKTPNKLSGIDIDGESFEIKSHEPLEYYIEEWYGDDEV